jgi:LPS-assembly protein
MTRSPRRGQISGIASVLLLSLLMALPAAGQVLPSSPLSSKVSKNSDQPIEITAEQLQYLREEDRYIADGNVRVTQGAVQLTADHVNLDRRDGLARARGHAILRQGEDVLSADQLDYNLRTQNGIAVPGQIFVKKENYHIQADRMEKQGENHYELKIWSVTSCDTDEGESPVWRIRGRTARVDLGQYLVARDVVLYVKGVPIMYTPYLILPVNTNRQSGFLIPRFGYNTTDGLRVSEAYYWAISPSQDATISLDYRSSRGTGLGLEYRYKLSRGSEGALRYAFFDDRITHNWETATQYVHTQRFSENFQARLDVNYVNNIDVFRNLSSTTALRILPSLTSNFIVFRRWDNQELYLLAQYTQNLVDQTDTTLQILPELGYSLHEYRLGQLPLYAELDATAVNFWRKEQDVASGSIRAIRLDAYPRLWISLNVGGIVLTPRAGYRETWYNRDLDSDAPAHRGVEILGLGANTRMFRTFGPTNSAHWTHAIEPAVVYDYVPFVDQSNLPHFDDLDQLPEKNSITYSLTNRLGREDQSDSESPSAREWIFWKVTQTYDVHAKRLESDPGPARPFSNLRSEFVLSPSRYFSLDTDSFYNLYEHNTVTLDNDVRLSINRWITTAVGQYYSRAGAPTPIGDPINSLAPANPSFWYSQPSPLIRFLKGETRIDLPGRVILTGRTYYDVTERIFAEQNYGIQYIGQCWGFAISYQHLTDRNQWEFLITLRPQDMAHSATAMF